MIESLGYRSSSGESRPNNGARWSQRQVGDSTTRLGNTSRTRISEGDSERNQPMTQRRESLLTHIQRSARRPHKKIPQHTPNRMILTTIRVDDCAVCLTGFKPNMKVAIYSCGHQLHEKCYIQTIQLNKQFTDTCLMNCNL